MKQSILPPLVMALFLFLSALGVSADTLGQQFSQMNFGDRVTVQSNLKQLGHYHSEIDGLWGGGTKRSIELFASAIGRSLNTSADINNLLTEILYLELGEEGEGTQTNDIPDTSAVPAWINYRTDPEGISVKEWLSSSDPIKIATAATYYSSMLDDQTFSYMLNSGLLEAKSVEVARCINQIVGATLQTGQASTSERIYPRFANSCVMLTNFPND